MSGRKVSFNEIMNSSIRLKDKVVKTPLLQSSYLNQKLKTNLFLKAENLQTIGAFKYRGALNAVLQLPDNIKKIVARLNSDKRSEVDNHRKVFRPWGYYDSVNSEEGFQVKRIVVNSGAKLSLQKHKYRAEHWVVVKGVALVTCGDKTFELVENQSTYIPQGSLHRLENHQDTPLEIIEIQTGSYLGEDDIVRFEDKYGRVK